MRDAEIINLELILADLQTVENRISKVERKASSGDKEAKAEMNLLSRLRPHLESGLPARSLEISEDEKPVLRQYGLLTTKPVIYVANMDDEGIADPLSNGYYAALKELAEKEGAGIVAVCARLEEELSALEPEEKDAFLEDLGLPQSGLDHLIQTAYKALDLCTFLTAGSDECRAWTFRRGMKAPECAGVIHSDFQRGFIRAEVYAFEDIDALESEQAVKEAGKMRLEGKEYVVQDGDVMHFRFNV